MRLRNIPGAREAITANEFVMPESSPCKGTWNEKFGNKNPLFLEIGMGKGQFITRMASEHPQNNYIGIEKYSSVLIRALEKREAYPEVDNLFYIRMEAEYLTDWFEKDEVSGIYLNFSDPWPKDRHAKRRLPSRQFLHLYEQILVPNGRVEFKTDNRALFDFALEEQQIAGWKLIEHTFDLHNHPTMNEGNIMTEYEERFSSAGNPICKMVIERP